jgi:hypothetical protein
MTLEADINAIAAIRELEWTNLLPFMSANGRLRLLVEIMTIKASWTYTKWHSQPGPRKPAPNTALNSAADAQQRHQRPNNSSIQIQKHSKEPF